MLASLGDRPVRPVRARLSGTGNLTIYGTIGTGPTRAWAALATVGGGSAWAPSAPVVLPTGPDALDPFTALFSESSARALVAVTGAAQQAFTDLCDAAGQSYTRLGIIGTGAGGGTGGAQLDIDGVCVLGLDELREAWTGTLPAIFG